MFWESVHTQGATSPNSPPNRGRPRPAKEDSEDTEGNKGKGATEGLVSKGQFRWKLIWPAMSWEAGRFLGYDPLPVSLLPTLVSAGRIIKDKAEPACFHSRHAERALSSKWISPQFLLFSSSFFLPNGTTCQLCTGVSDSSLSAQHVWEPTTDFVFFPC